jgi:hypothetical protein
MQGVMPLSNSVQLRRIGFDDVSERALFILSAEKPSDISNISIVTGCRYFVAFIAWESENESPSDIARVARMLLDAGCVYFCCWGPGCERMHDIVDEEYVGDGSSVLDHDLIIMTTWHDDESLEESVWFALHAAFPDNRFFDECKAVVAICIGNKTTEKQLVAALADPERWSHV